MNQEFFTLIRFRVNLIQTFELTDANDIQTCFNQVGKHLNNFVIHWDAFSVGKNVQAVERADECSMRLRLIVNLSSQIKELKTFNHLALINRFHCI